MKIKNYEKAIKTLVVFVLAIIIYMSNAVVYASSFKEEIKEYKNQIAQHKEQIDKHEKKIETLKKRIDQEKEQISGLREEISANEKKKIEIDNNIKKNNLEYYKNKEKIKKEMFKDPLATEIFTSPDLMSAMVDLYISKYNEYQNLQKELSKEISKKPNDIILNRLINNNTPPYNMKHEKTLNSLYNLNIEKDILQSNLVKLDNEIKVKFKQIEEINKTLKIDTYNYNKELNDKTHIEATKKEIEEEKTKKEILLREEIERNAKHLWPTTTHNITSVYGWRTDPIKGGKQLHSGLDLAAPEGTSILATKAGKVIYSGWRGNYGKLIIIDHGNGVTTRYGHLSKTIAKHGDRVEQGEKIGLMGTTGYSTGSHLHFEYRIDNVHKDPLKYLTKER